MGVMTRALAPGEFYGSTTSVRIADAILSEVTHYERRTLPAHTHDWPYFSVLLEGSYVETTGRTTIDYRPLTAVFHGAHLTHSDEIGAEGSRFFLIELGPTWVDLAQGLGGIPEHMFELHGEHASWLGLRLYHEFREPEDRRSETAIEELLLELCAYLPSAPAPEKNEPPWMARVIEIVAADFRTHYDLRSLAEKVHVHPSHLARTFHRFHRRTIGDMVNRLRVQEACRRLAESDATLTEIASESGFSDQSHMTRAVRRLTGSTPGAYRKAMTKV
jgi:AraC family transcriptional regulator